MLIKMGAITETQLEQALTAQSVYGGRLGTNLLEMGLIGEDELARILTQKLGVPCIDAATLNAIPKEVIDVIPLDMVQRYHVLPVALDGKRLTLAMADPSDFNAIDEIGFVTGLVVVPRVCSELRLNLALEHYCDIKRSIRYIPVQGGLRSRFNGDATHEDADAEGLPAQEEPVVGLCYGQHFTIQVLAERLAAVSREVQVVSALLAYLGGEFDRCGFFSLKGGTALGVQALGKGTEVEGFPGHAISVQDAKLLNRVVQERHLFLGELEAGGADAQLVESMGGDTPAPAVVVPLSVGGKVAAVICANDEKGRLAGGVFQLQQVAAMGELAFEMLCIRKRLRSGLG